MVTMPQLFYRLESIARTDVYASRNPNFDNKTYLVMTAAGASITDGNSGVKPTSIM
jgi:hypothetical protein